MINVWINRSAINKYIYSFEVSGHANYAELGQDIVCAGISAVTVGTVNAIEKMLGIVVKSHMEDGFLQAEIPDILESNLSEKLQLILETMVVMLETIEVNYGSYIQIQQGNRKRR